MRIVDANVLLNAVNRSAADHQVAKRWLDDALSGGGPIGLAWVVLLAVARLTTRPGLFTRPLTVTEVTRLLRGLLDAPTTIVVHPGERHLDLLSELLHGSGTAGNLTTDAHLAALAVEHNATIVTFDADFDRFSGVRWTRPT